MHVLFKKFDEYCKAKQNRTMECYKFNMPNQGKEETVNQYITTLRLLAKNCNFGTLKDEMIRDRLVCGIMSECMKGHLLREQELSLMMICQVDEEYSKQMKFLSEEEPEQVVQAVKQTSQQAKPVRAKPQDRELQEASQQC